MIGRSLKSDEGLERYILLKWNIESFTGQVLAFLRLSIHLSTWLKDAKIKVDRESCYCIFPLSINVIKVVLLLVYCNCLIVSL